LEVPGVLGSDAGPSGLRVTADPASGPLIGVSATAQSDDRYAIDLSLVADMVPLQPLAETVRARVRGRADGEQLGAALGAVNVEFASVVTAEEFAVTVAEQQAEEAILAEEPAAGGATAPEVVAAPASAGPAPKGERRLGAPAAAASPRGPDAAAALAARQAALATDQAALAAKQAALAAEQAALAVERAALAAEPAAPPTSLDSEHDAGLVTENDGEAKR
jgi:hypothetical protein